MNTRGAGNAARYAGHVRSCGARSVAIVGNVGAATGHQGDASGKAATLCPRLGHALQQYVKLHAPPNVTEVRLLSASVETDFLRMLQAPVLLGAVSSFSHWAAYLKGQSGFPGRAVLPKANTCGDESGEGMWPIGNDSLATPFVQVSPADVIFARRIAFQPESAVLAAVTAKKCRDDGECCPRGKK